MPNFLSRINLRPFPELDTIRFLSIFLVVLHHQHFVSNPILEWFNHHGWIGVDVFFGMSGYLITTLLLKELDKTNGINLKSFWFKRMLRLWPSWFFTLILSFSFVYALSANNPLVRTQLREKWWHYFLHFGNYSYIFEDKIHGLYTIFWSLAVEEHFYLLWPLLLLSIRPKKALLISIWTLIVLSWVFRVYHLVNGQGDLIVAFSTHTRIDELLFGCLLAIHFPKIKEFGWKFETIAVCLMLFFYWFGLHVCKGNTDILLNSLTYTFIGVANCLLIIIALKGGKGGLRRALANPILAKLGVLSYGVYLIHLHMNYIVFSLSKKMPFLHNENLLAAINLALPFIPAYFMYFYLDEYFAKFKQVIPLPEVQEKPIYESIHS